MPLPVVSENVRNQFENLGHVYVTGVYGVDRAALLGTEIDDLVSNVRPSSIMALGEQKRGLENPHISSEKHRALSLVLGEIGVFASEVLGRNLWPAISPSRTLIDAIDMNPIIIGSMRHTEARTLPVQGTRHTDRPDIAGLVALTTYEGKSKLHFDDDTSYDLIPGGVAYFNPILFHQGSAFVKRRAFVVARTTSNLSKNKVN